jgi:hypothetical protein
MSKWKFGSLDWIHKVRADNYRKTKGEDLKSVMEESVKKARKSAPH